MILTCPQCATRYQVDAEKFPPTGRNVRCAKCGHVWHQLGPTPEPDPDVEIVVHELPPRPPPAESDLRDAAHAPMSSMRPASQEVDRESTGSSWLRGIAVAGGWLFLVVLVLAIGWGAFAFRDDIATWLPQTSSLYAAVGLHVNPRGMELTDISYRRQVEDGQVVLAVTGNVVNRSGHELSVPLLRVALFDADKHELYHWTFLSAVSTLKPGESARFRTRLPSPPPGTQDIEVRFARMGE